MVEVGCSIHPGPINMVDRKRGKLLNSNIWKYYALRVLSKRLVWPILTIFLLRNQLSATEIGIIFSVGVMIGLVLEVPSGAIADKIGRKRCMAIAFFGWALSMFIFWQGNSFLAFLLANSIYWAAGSLWSGTSEAFIYETLQELGRENEIKKVSGRALFISQVSTGILFVGTPVIAKFSLTLPFLINAIVLLFGFFMVLTLIEPVRSKSVMEEEVGKDFFGFRAFFSNRSLLIIGSVFAFIAGINGVLEDFRQVYLDFIHLDIVYFGLVYLALRLLTGLFGVFEERIEKRIGRENTFLLMPVVSLVAYTGLFLINSFYGLLFVALDGIREGISRPLEQEYLNKVINNNRATMISIFNFIENIIRALAVFFSGMIIDRFGINNVFLFLIILLFVFVGPLTLLFLKRLKETKNFSSKVSKS